MKTLRWRCQPGLPRKHPTGVGKTFSALASFRPETIMAVMASVWMVRPSVRAEAMELSQFWTATAPLSSAWVNVASVADPAQESFQPFRVTSSRVRRAKKDGNSALA